MSDRDDLLAEIQSVLASGGANVISASDLDDLYEAYVVTALVQAAIAEQWTVRLEDITEAPISTALFRRSPGNILFMANSKIPEHWLPVSRSW